MTSRSYELAGVRILECAPGGGVLRTGADAVALIGTAWEQRARCIVIPVARLAEDFFRLQNGIAGEFIQKFVTYRMRLAIVGDISEQAAESKALRDFVREANSGDQICFLSTLEDLEQVLDQRAEGIRPPPA